MPEPLKPRDIDSLAPTALPGATPSAADLDRTATQPDAPQFANTEFEVELGTIGRYRVLKKLGQGGMGAVFLATDTTLARKVALKVMLPQYAAKPDARARFLREARTAAMVHSDHVVTIFDVGGEGDETPFIAMEYLLGAPLDEYLKQKGELPLAHVLRVARETALGLAAAHELGLVHRDIKPANLWLEAPKGRVKLLDFGLARVEDDDTHLTGTGAVVGTPSYMSPEQARGEKVDQRTDLFSVGVLLYRLTTGKLPFSGPTTMAVLTSLAIDTPPPPRSLNPNVPPALDAIIVQLLSKSPEGRFQSAPELAEAIREVEHPRASGPLPVIVTAPALVVEARSPNVWEGIDDSTSRAVPVGDSARHEGTELDAEPVAPEARRKPERGSRLPLIGAGVVLLLACAALAAVLMRPANGTLVVESDDAEAELVLKRDGAIVRDRTRERELVLPAGAYAVELADPRPGAKLSADRVEVPKNGTGRVRVIVEKKVTRPPVQPPIQPPVQPPVLPPAKPSAEREAAELVISLGGYVRLHTGDRENIRGYRDVAKLPGGNFALAQVHIDSRDKPRVLADAVLEKFKECKALTHLNLHGCTVTDAGLAHFAACPQLKELALYGPKVTDAGLAHFKGCALLERLDLQGTGATDAGLAHFKGCARLKALRLAEMKVSAAGLAQFKGCAQLESISLEGTPLPAADLAALGGRTELRELDLTGTGVGNDALPHFKGCPALRAVNLARTAVSDAGLVAFKGNAALRELNLSGTEVSGAGLAHLAGCPRLGSLHLAGAKQLTNDALAALKGCPDLYSLNLQGAPLTDAALAHLEGLTGLQVLQLRGTKVTTDAARKLAEKLPDCRIEWSGGAIEPRADPDRKSAEALWGVGLWSIFVNGKEAQGFTAPEQLPRERFELRSVYVNRNKSVTDDSFACLKGCRHLVSVQITNVGIGNTTLSYLKDSKHLESLTLYATGVTDEGLKELVGFKDLRALDLTQLPLSEPAVKALAAELPNCAISWKGGTIAPAKK
jgi:eukaryotic-like serine/threonine-protein kinase